MLGLIPSTFAGTSNAFAGTVNERMAPRPRSVAVSFAFRPMTRDQNVYVLAVQGDQRLFNAVPFDRFGNHDDTATRYEIGVWYDVRYEIDLDASEQSRGQSTFHKPKKRGDSAASTV